MATTESNAQEKHEIREVVRQRYTAAATKVAQAVRLRTVRRRRYGCYRSWFWQSSRSQ